MESEGRKLHAQAAQAREAGNTAESLYRGDDALLAYDTADDSAGFAELLADRSITLRNYANQQESESRRLLILAKHEMMASVEIAQEAGDPTALALPMYNYAKVLEDLGEISQAVSSYQEAVTHMEQNPPESHNRPSVLLDMKIHLCAAEAKNGDESAQKRLEELVNQLEQTEEPSQYAKDVWVSGGYMKLAEAFKAYQQKSQEYLKKAQTIADGNPELSERRKQIDKLAQTLRY
ncbi:MAG TPA: hypothetical protein PLD54_03355 [Candidatus Levybacteria bacterium]|nr:hypothetical protein [Candidatus Levybacteria bacterium]